MQLMQVKRVTLCPCAFNSFHLHVAPITSERHLFDDVYPISCPFDNCFLSPSFFHGAFVRLGNCSHFDFYFHLQSTELITLLRYINRLFTGIRAKESASALA